MKIARFKRNIKNWIFKKFELQLRKYGYLTKETLYIPQIRVYNPIRVNSQVIINKSQMPSAYLHLEKNKVYDKLFEEVKQYVNIRETQLYHPDEIEINAQLIIGHERK